MHAYIIEEKTGCNLLLEANSALLVKTPVKDDIFAFIGQEDSVLYINKITDPYTGKSCYPEIMFAHPFIENEIADNSIYHLFLYAKKSFILRNIYFFTCPANQREKIYSWVKNRLLHIEEKAPKFTEDEENMIEHISRGLILTQSMRYDFKRLCMSKKIRDGGLVDVLTGYINTSAGSKRERSIIYDEISSKLNLVNY